MQGRSGTELGRVPLVPSYLGYLGYRVIWGTSCTELGRVPWIPSYTGYLIYQVRWGTPGTDSDYVELFRLMDTWRSTTIFPLSP